MSVPNDIRTFNRSVIEEFRATGGAMSGDREWPRPLILLTTTGARSGREHTVPLGNLSDEPSRVIVGGGFLRGPRNAQWYTNVVNNPAVVLERPGTDGRVERVETTAVIPDGAERARIVERVRLLGPQLDEFEAETGRPMPIVVLDC